MHRKTAIKILFVIYCVVMMQLLFFRSPSSNNMPYWQIIRENINIIPLATIRNQIHLILHIEDYGDTEIDVDADFGDVDVVEEPIEPEINVEADIDISEIADIAEGAEEAAELIAALL